MDRDPRSLLLAMFDAAVGAASPARCVPPHLPAAPKGRTVVVGAGKAAAAMAAAVEASWSGPLEGLVVTRYGHGVPCRHIRVVEAGHPVPDEAGMAASREMLELARGLGADDLLLCLVSGGGSSLLALPAEGLTLSDKQAVNRALLRSGARIDEMNTVRKQLSAIKGGRLARAAAPARIVALVISDVPGDDPSVVASGPTVEDRTTPEDALAILVRYGIDMPPSVAKHLSKPAASADGPFPAGQVVTIAAPQDALEAAATVARLAGITPIILGNAIEGEARDVARVHAAIARQCAEHGQPAPGPCVLLSGGETTITVRGEGRGGRNAEFLLALAIALDGRAGIAALAADTDGIDGSENNAGAVLTPDTLRRARNAGFDPVRSLAANDAYTLFEALGDLVVTGPTRTNVNDFRALLVTPLPNAQETDRPPEEKFMSRPQSTGPIRTLINGEAREISGVAPATTILEHLRRTERLTGTKEGCAEGDCGACTVLLTEPDGAGGLRRRAVNSCIQFVPTLHGRSVETIESLGAEETHPLQTAMVEQHASQCGFCTPGFVMQLYGGWLNGEISDRQSVKDLVSGNLCRCTGYGPIVEAGLCLGRSKPTVDRAAEGALAEHLTTLAGDTMLAYEAAGGRWYAPRDAEELAETYAAHPDAVLVAGATDVGLWVTKQHRALPLLIDVSRVRDLALIDEQPGRARLGAGVTLAAAAPILARIHPDLSEVMRRFAGHQIRAMGTIGGNVANGSPIGDLPPILIALGAELHLRHGPRARTIHIEDFFIEYGRQDRAKGEFVVGVDVPHLAATDVFFARKLSKRFDSDISAVMAAFRLRIEAGIVTEAVLAFGGMAGTPARAKQAEAALLGSPFGATSAARAAQALASDFKPLTDMRASSGYRLEAAGNLIRRFQIETAEGRAGVDLFDMMAEVA